MLPVDKKPERNKLKDLNKQNESLKYCEIDAVRKTIIAEMPKIENEKNKYS